MTTAINILLFLAAWFVIDRLICLGFKRLANLQRAPLLMWRIFERAARILAFATVAIGAAEYFSLAPRDLWIAFSTIAALIAAGFIAFWSVLSNHVCALILMITQPFKLGDYIEIFEVGSDKIAVFGKVIDFTLVFVVLESEDGSRTFLPLNQVMQKAIKVRNKH